MAPEESAVVAASDEATQSSEASNSPQSAYNDLRQLIPRLAFELENLRTSLREHDLWLQRYGHRPNGPPDPSAVAQPAAADAAPIPDPPAALDNELPAYSASDVPPYGDAREEVAERRNQLVDWLREGEDVLREYSARFAQLASELQLPPEDLLGTWQEAAPDNALPDYERIEYREELMVGGVGEVPPPYVRRHD